MIRKVVVQLYGVEPIGAYAVSEGQLNKLNHYLRSHRCPEMKDRVPYTLWIDRVVSAYEGTPISIAVCVKAANVLFSGNERARFHIVEYKEWEIGD